MFVKANINQAKVLKNVLNTFGAASGHKVNRLKTTVFFYSNMDSDHANVICSILGYCQSEDLGIYLGLPLFHRRITVNTFKFIVDKVR